LPGVHAAGSNDLPWVPGSNGAGSKDPAYTLRRVWTHARERVPKHNHQITQSRNHQIPQGCLFLQQPAKARPTNGRSIRSMSGLTISPTINEDPVTTDEDPARNRDGL